MFKHGADAQLVAMWCDPAANHLVLSLRVQVRTSPHLQQRRTTSLRGQQASRHDAGPASRRQQGGGSKRDHPRGSAGMLPCRAQGTPEVQYLHRKWTKTRTLAKLRGTNLTALAWPPLAPAAPPPEAPGPSAGGKEPQEGDGGPTLTASCTG